MTCAEHNQELSDPAAVSSAVRLLLLVKGWLRGQMFRPDSSGRLPDGHLLREVDDLTMPARQVSSSSVVLSSTPFPSSPCLLQPLLRPLSSEPSCCNTFVLFNIVRHSLRISSSRYQPSLLLCTHVYLLMSMYSCLCTHVSAQLRKIRQRQQEHDSRAALKPPPFATGQIRRCKSALLHAHLSQLPDYLPSLFGCEQWLRCQLKALVTLEVKTELFAAWKNYAGAFILSYHTPLAVYLISGYTYVMMFALLTCYSLITMIRLVT